MTSIEWASLDAIKARAKAYAEHGTPGLAAPKDRADLLAIIDAAFPIIRDLIDPDPCEFDHHGGCQAHGYLSLQPGETCPQHDAKEWIKANEEGK